MNALEFVIVQSLLQKKKSLNLGAKMPDLGILGLKFENTVVINKFSAFQFVKF